MKFTILSGSPRNESESFKVAKFFQKSLAMQAPGSSCYFLSLANNPLPLWDESVFDSAPIWQKLWHPIRSELQSSDAFVFVVPEYNGMVPSAVINFFQLCSSHELGHKPGLIATVSATRGGSYPAAELRMLTSKNNRLCYIPEQVIVREAPKMLNGDTIASEDDGYLRERIGYTLRLLHAYAQAMTGLRASGVIDHKAYPNGM